MAPVPVECFHHRLYLIYLRRIRIIILSGIGVDKLVPRPYTESPIIDHNRRSSMYDMHCRMQVHVSARCSVSVLFRTLNCRHRPNKLKIYFKSSITSTH